MKMFKSYGILKVCTQGAPVTQNYCFLFSADRGSHSPTPVPMDILEGHCGAVSSSNIPDDEDEAMQCEDNIIKVSKLRFL